ncbi:unnamed protein product [Gadus morhua 'NCC']
MNNLQMNYKVPSYHTLWCPGTGKDIEKTAMALALHTAQRHLRVQESLHVDAPGSSHMSGHNGELRILSVYRKGEGPLALDGHDTLFAVCKLEALSSPSADHSVAKRLERGHERLVHLEEPSGHRGGRKGRPYVLFGHPHAYPHRREAVLVRPMHEALSEQSQPEDPHEESGEKPYGCEKCMKGFSQNCSLKVHMRTHSGEKPCVCLQCNGSFSDPSSLRVHMLKHTGNGVLGHWATRHFD